MSMVLDCGFTGTNAYGTDIFPLKVDLVLMDAMDECRNPRRQRRNPFESFPQLEKVFRRHLYNVLQWGKVLLVFGEVAWEYVDKWLDVEELTLNACPNLELFVEFKVLSTVN